jgi:outer membrane protein assembly factor BamB
VYFSSQPDEKKKEATLWALSQTDGSEQWNFPLPGQPWGSPEQGVDPETLLTTTGIGQVGVTLETDHGWAHALRKNGTKKLIWTHELPGNPIELGRVLRSEGLIFYVLTKGEVFALHANDGSIAWTKKLSGPVQADPVLIENPPTLITFENGGLLSAFGAIDGKLIYSQKLPVGGSSAPLVVEDGFIAVTPYRLVRFQW